MANQKPGEKIIAVTKENSLAASLLRHILHRCSRESCIAVENESSLEKAIRPAVLLVAEEDEVKRLRDCVICVTEYSLSLLPDFHGMQKIVTYSTEQNGADFTARNIRFLPGGITAFEIVGVGIIGRTRLKTQIPGIAGTALAAASAAIAAGIPFADVLEAMNGMESADWQKL
ncbi:MAG: hypothetical protein LKJ45_04625 [Oscillospiraceae bacterium]|jgi:hypothetical protein|nr:hypothetical protein [Oscillospiraceae bacterium]